LFDKKYKRIKDEREYIICKNYNKNFFVHSWGIFVFVTIEDVSFLLMRMNYSLRSIKILAIYSNSILNIPGVILFFI
jgi:hypothetical protein